MIEPGEISQICADVFGVEFVRLFERTREIDVIKPRYTAICLIKENMAIKTTVAIAAHFNLKQHSTVLNAMVQASNLFETDREFRQKYSECALKVRELYEERVQELRAKDEVEAGIDDDNFIPFIYYD